MVRIGVFTGKSDYKGLALLDFKVLGELETSSMDKNVEKFSLVARYLDYKERMRPNRIYMISIMDDEDFSKPIRHYTILDKAKFVKYVNGEYLITYKRYSGLNILDLYENRTEETQKYIDFCLERGKETPRLHFNTFTKNVLEQIFNNYGYENVIRYDSKSELKEWRREVIDKIKKSYEVEEKSSYWSEEELEYLLLHKDKMSEKELARRLGRTVAAVATKKWKLNSKYNKSLKDVIMDRKKLINKKLKEYREIKGFSQADLSEESGTSLSVINQLECENYNNTYTPTVLKLLNHIEKNSSITITDLDPKPKIEKKKPGRKPGSKNKVKRVVKKEVATKDMEPASAEKEDLFSMANSEVELNVVDEPNSNQQPKEEAPHSSEVTLLSLHNEVASLREMIANVLKSHMNVNLENKILKKEKKAVISLLGNKISEGIA
jgi:transcriptional regulator with XRE-family HTH domain